MDIYSSWKYNGLSIKDVRTRGNEGGLPKPDGGRGLKANMEAHKKF